MIRVSVSAASPVWRAGLISLLRESPQIEVTESEPDVVLAEVEEPEEDLAALAWEHRSPALVLLAGDTREPWVAEVLRNGVRAVLPRNVGGTELIAAIEAAAAGFVVLLPEDLQALLPAAARASPTAAGEALTARELEVLKLLAEGDGNKSIAWRLGISEHTVKFHVASIISKLQAGSRTEAVATGIRRGLIPL